ncbi:MAG: MBL fold metallo-hydrolase [Phycisphaera sp.]|nr:MBL fold metallo-hydrolase [Phycisphaera sp.]
MSLEPAPQMMLFDSPAAAGRSMTRAPRSKRLVPSDRLSLCVLGSGSGGNCSVVRRGQKALLIDAGFSPRRTNKLLTQAGVDPSFILGLLVTHLDRDHFHPHQVRQLRLWRVPLFIHRWHLRHLARVPGQSQLHDEGLVRTIDSLPFDPTPDFHVTTVTLPHDDKGTVGFRIDTPSGSLGYATDLGHVPQSLIDCFAGKQPQPLTDAPSQEPSPLTSRPVDILAIESNYDPRMQLTSSRPDFLKDRIMGKHGHLSNEQTLDALRALVRASDNRTPQHIALLHRSSQCNSPDIIRRLFADHPDLHRRTTLTEQRRHSPWLSVNPDRTTQLTLDW